jgi:HEAT repeat protein
MSLSDCTESSVKREMHMSTEDIAQLIKDCQSGERAKQISAMFALSELEAIEAIPVIIGVLLSDKDEDVREDAALVLRFLGDQQPLPDTVGPALLKALDDTAAGVRCNAADTLGYLHYLPAISRLRNLLHRDPAGLVRASAAEALGRLEDEASIPDLQQAITDPDPQVQWDAVIALGQFIQSPMIAPFVATHLSNERLDPVVKAELLALSYRLGHRSHLRDLLALLSQAKDNDLTTNILTVLIDLTDKVPPADFLEEEQTAIQSTLQKVQFNHPSLRSDVERVRHNLEVAKNIDE